MSSTARHVALILLVGSIVLFSNLGGPRLWDRDEPRNAGCAAEMLSRGDFITPVFDDELRTHKPILLYWLMMTAYGVFGVNEFAARFWSATLGIGTACLTYGLGRRLFSAEVGLWAAIILVTTLMFDVAGRAATPDGLLIFWNTAAIAVYVWGVFPGSGTSEPSGTPIRMFPKWPTAALMYGMMGMAVLAKGPVGLVLPTAVIGMYLLLQRLSPRTAITGNWGARASELCVRALRPFEPRHFLSTCWLMRPITALAVVAVVALPWYIAVALRTDGEWVKGFLMDHNVGRAAQSLEGHGGSFVYYPLALLIGFFPWSVFAVPTILEWVRRVRTDDTRSSGFVLAACWIGVYIGLFSIARTKLPSYISPCYPAVALLVASYLVAWINAESRSAAYWPRAAFTCLGLVGMCLAIAVPVAAAKLVPGEEWLALLGCVPMLTAIAALGFTRANKPGQAAVAFATGAALFTTSLFAVGAAQIDRHQTFDSFIAEAFQRSSDPRIGTLGVLEPSWVFYTQRPFDHLFAPEITAGTDKLTPMLGPQRTEDWQFKPFHNVWAFLQADTDRFVITTHSQLEMIGSLPAHVEVIARAAYFLRDEELVMLSARSRVTALPADGELDIERR